MVFLPAIRTTMCVPVGDVRWLASLVEAYNRFEEECDLGRF